MPRILISGGNGFLGSYVANNAIKKGDEVVVVDDLSTSRGRNVPDNVKFIKMTIEDFETTETFDYVLHLAARPSPEDYIDHPVSTIMSNSLGTKRMLDIALRSRAVFMYTSSSEVYGEASVIPTPESYYGYVNPNGIRSCYDEGKRYSEALIMAYSRQYNLDVKIQRPFNVYGPGIRPDGQYGRVIPRFIMQALRNEPLTIHGDGTQTRSFLYVEDWLNATLALLYSHAPSGTVVNIGSSSQISIADLARLIIEMTGSDSQLVHGDRREDDPTRRSADISAAKRLLEWTPKLSLESGLKATIEWLRGRIS